MPVRTLSVALLAANAAFADVVCRTLEERPNYRVPRFSSVGALTTFMRIAPVDVVVFDTDMPGTSPIDIVQHLRANARLANPQFKTIVLTRAAVPFQVPILAAGVDMVLQKPVPPRHLLEAIDGLHTNQRLLAASGQTHHAPRPAIRARRTNPMPFERGGNVIPLFGECRSAR